MVLHRAALGDRAADNPWATGMNNGTSLVTAMAADPRTYRFADAQPPGLLLGLGARQAVPVIAGVMVLALWLQSPLPPMVGLVGPIIGVAIAFGRWRGAPISETLIPGVRGWTRRRLGRNRWCRPPLLGDNTTGALPRQLAGLELLDHCSGEGALTVVRDRTAGTVSAVLRLHAHGFPLASGTEQDSMLAAWGSALSPFARERSPVVSVTWHEWSHPIGADAHRDFLAHVGAIGPDSGEVAGDYVQFIEEQAPVSVAHDVLIVVTVDERLVRTRRSSTSRLGTAVETLADEVRLFTARLDAAGLIVDGPLDALELAASLRVRSDPGRVDQVATLARSLAAASGRGAPEWGPMVVEPHWTHVCVDGALHRCYRVAGWPQLPVGSDWLSDLVSETRAVRTVTVVLEPVPMSRAARAADREVMAREADADMKTQKGFRVNARERKRLHDVEARERELSEGHAEFHFVGFVDVSAPDLESLDDACADVEQAAAQSLLDLRPLDARHDLGWVASLPLGRALVRRP